MIQIRKALWTEAAALGELAMRSKGHWPHDRAYLELCRPIITPTEKYISEWPVIVACLEGQIVGWASLYEKKGKRWLDNLWIDPPHFKKGYGSLLFLECVREARQLAWDSFEIAADPYAEQFYFKIGATRVGDMESFVKPGFFIPLMKFVLPTVLPF